MKLPRLYRRRAAATAAAVAAVAVLAGCSSTGSSTSSAGDQAATSAAEELRLGFFANVTHATPLVGTSEGFLEESLGDTKLSTQVFNAGPAAVEAIFAGTLDASYIGPNPAINAFTKSNGEAVRIIAGATSGGASLVVREGITTAEQLRGKTLATPQLGNTQDVAVRAWLGEQGLQTTPTGGGDVTITPTENATTLQLFRDGAIDGAWLPEPWASRLVLEAGATVLVDERELWPDGQFVTTHLIVRTEFLEQHPETVRALLEGHVQSVEFIKANPDQAKTDVNAKLTELGGKPLSQEVIDRAWTNLSFTEDPVAPSLQQSADDAVAAEVLDEAPLDGIYDLGPLNEVLAEQGLPQVSDAGLGVDSP